MLAEELVVKSVVAPDTRSAGSVASCRSEGGELDVDSDSQGLVLTSFDSLVKKEELLPKYCVK